MALSNTERQKRFREKQRQKRSERLRKADTAIVHAKPKVPFHQYFDDHGEEQTFTMCLDTAGIDPSIFNDDSGPKSATGEIENLFEGNPSESVYYGQGNSLAKAEIMVGQLIDAAAALARIINDYKREAIDARISELEASDLSDAEVKKQAFAEMAELREMRDQLEKQVRWTFPQWKVTGE